MWGSSDHILLSEPAPEKDGVLAVIGQENMPFPGGVVKDQLYSNCSRYGGKGTKYWVSLFCLWPVPKHKHTMEISLLNTMILLLKSRKTLQMEISFIKAKVKFKCIVLNYKIKFMEFIWSALHDESLSKLNNSAIANKLITGLYSNDPDLLVFV